MKTDRFLRLQAWLDGELPAAEAREVEADLVRDQELQPFLGELRHVRTAMSVGEPLRPHPETREFFWSKIERSIRAGSPAEVIPVGRPKWQRWVGLVVPAVAGVTLALFLALPGLRSLGPQPVSGADIDSPCDDLSSFSFRSETEGMNVVWISVN